MAHALLFAAAIAACLFWTAACVAAAARTERAWLRRLLVAAGVLLPMVLLLPWVVLTAVLARQGWRPNFFAAVLTTFLSAAIGGWWIWRAGTSRAASGQGIVAAAWPAFGLAAAFLAAEALTMGTLVSIDHEASARSRALRAEAAQLMQASLPPAPAPDDDAAPLYERVFAALDADKGFFGDTSPLHDPLAADVAAADVKEILARHAPTLELVRRAADKPGCRFVLDWSRPSFDMLLPELPPMRNAARLLALAARSAAAAGDTAAALRDVVQIHRIGMHAAGEPLIISGLLGTAIDTIAIQTLAAVLPTIGKEDLGLLDEKSLTDFIGTVPSYGRHLLGGEEAAGLGTFADPTRGELALFYDTEVPWIARAMPGPVRRFFMVAELAGYREAFAQYRTVMSNAPDNVPEFERRIAAIEGDVRRRQAGLLEGLVTPMLGNTLRTRFNSLALHRAAEVLVAATRFRLATGGLPESMEALVPDFLARVPLDPCTKDAPLRLRRTDDGSIVVFAVGPDGEDDGGPPPPGKENPAENDDVGLSLRGGT